MAYTSSRFFLSRAEVRALRTSETTRQRIRRCSHNVKVLTRKLSRLRGSVMSPQAMLPSQLGSPARAPAPEVAAPHLGLVLNLQTYLNFPIRSDVSQLSAEQLGSRCGEHKVLRERVLRD